MDERQSYEPESTSCACGGRLLVEPELDRIRQQIELPERPLRIIELRGKAYRCKRCGRQHYGRIPSRCERCGRQHYGRIPSQALATGFVGPKLSATLAYLKIKAHASYTALSCFTDEVLGCRVSRGELAKLSKNCPVP